MRHACSTNSCDTLKKRTAVHPETVQDWASSLAAPDGGSVKGMPSAIDTQQTLADILTAIIFTCGPQHSAINFTQFYYGGYALNMPLTARKGYHDIVNRPASQPIKEQELLKFLPNLEMTRCAGHPVCTSCAGMHIMHCAQLECCLHALACNTCSFSGHWSCGIQSSFRVGQALAGSS
jgi:Lipoxygenase